MPRRRKTGSSSASAGKGGHEVLGVGGRLREGPAPELVDSAFARELAEEDALFAGVGLADLAHTVALMDAGVIPRREGGVLLAALLELQEAPPDYSADPALGDLYTNREAWLERKTAAASWHGVGRARREAVTTGFLLLLRGKVLTLSETLGGAVSALVERAREHRESRMPDYTYLQAAQPTTFGHYLLAFAYPLLRDLDRLRALFERVNRSPAGCGSVNGSRLPLDRERLAELLGFDGPVTHARDAMWQADLAVEAAACAVCALVTLDRLAEDLQIFATEEFGFVEIPDSFARASVIHPQKKNPYALAFVRGTAGDAIGGLAAVAVGQLTPSGSVDNRIFAYGGLPRLYDAAGGAARVMAGVLRGLSFDREAAARRLASGFAFATDLVDVLMRETKLDPRAAHRVVGRLVRNALAAKRSATRLSPTDLVAAARSVTGRTLRLSAESLRDALDPAAAIEARRQTGGAAPARIAEMLRECRTRVATAAAWRARSRRRIREAETALLRRARQLRK